MTTRTSLLSVSAFALATLGASSFARAQLEPSPTDPAAPVTTGDPMTDPAAVGGPELTPIMLAPGRFDIRVPVAINMSSGAVAEPIKVPIDLYYGVNDNLTLGLSHSEGVVQPAMPYGLLFGSGICIGGQEKGCFKAYDNIGVDALFGLMRGVLQLALHGGLEMRSIDQSYWAARIGVLFQAPLATNIALVTDPRLSLGLNKRDLANLDILTLPLGVQFWLTPTTRLAARTVLSGVLDEFSDTYIGALGVFAGFGLTDMVEGFVSFDFADLYGKNSTADSRVLTVGVNFGM